MATRWEEQLTAIRRLRDEHRASDEALYAAQLRLKAATGDGVTRLRRAYEQAKRDFIDVRGALHAAVGKMLPDHVEGAFENLRDDIPILLLPLRIETRFVPVGEATELWIRAYPDDIAVHSHETTLTDEEVEAGEKYWNSLWPAGAGGATEEDKRAAWSYLADKFGGQRAAWVALQTKPTNWDVRDPDTQPAFPAHDLTKSSSWSRAPRTNVLPDRLVALLYQGENLVETIPGKLIPDALILGPDPMEDGDSFKTENGKLVFGDSFAWASNFQKAVDSGMGFKTRVTPEQARDGFSKVLVLGVRLSSNDADSKASLQTLIENHHYSPKGFAIVPQGTPTNNTDDGAAGFTKRDPFNVASYFVDAGDPLFTGGDGTDGCNLADALGIDYRPLQYVAGADGRDFAEAVAMNTALYPATLGYYFDTMLAGVLDAPTRDALREFYLASVTGRGSLPAIRVGNQPYGILLTSDFKNWEWSSEELAHSRGFLTGLHDAVSRYHEIWKGLEKRVPHVGRPNTQGDPSLALLEILGLQAGSVAFSQRTAYSTDYLLNRDGFQYNGRYTADIAKTFTSKKLLLDFMKSLGDRAGGNGSLTVPQLLRLVFQHTQTPIDAANLIDNLPLSEQRPVRYYDEALKKNYIDWLANARSIDTLERQDFGPGVTTPNSLLYQVLRRGLLLQLHAASVQWFVGKGVDVTATLAATNFYNIRPEPTLTKWEVMRAPVAVAVLRHPMKGKAVADHLLTSGRHEAESGLLNRVRASLDSLAVLPTARLERLLTEHIDTCTYRLDSWQSGMFDVRLRRQRASGPTPEDAKLQARKTGIYLGAVGWVENLKAAVRTVASAKGVPEKLRPPLGERLYEQRDNGGFVHTPSLNHAAAAAILRSGYLSHAQGDRPDAMAVNLSSERIRRALFLLQGVRNGQHLEALLGYQFERELHDAASADDGLIELNEYIYAFRDAFPIEKHFLQPQGSTPITVIPTSNVVNGVKLAEADGDAPYGATGSVASASPATMIAIRNAKDRLADSMDAVKDLLLCEGVFQTVQGNMDRAGAVMTAMKDTNIPPEIDVINTPRGSHLSFTNRVAVQFDNPDPAAVESNPWPLIAMTPRAQMEPGLNQWIGQVLGDPTALVCRVAHLDADGNELGDSEVTVDQLAIQPIDLVYLIGNELNTGSRDDSPENRTSASELEVRFAWIYRQAHALDDAVPIRIEFLKPADKTTLGRRLALLRTLKGMITDSRPLHAIDFDPASKKSLADPANPEGYDVADLTDRVKGARATSESVRVAIDTLAIDALINDDGVEDHYFTLQTTFDALTDAKLTLVDIDFTFEDVDARALQNSLRAAATLGMSDAFPAALGLGDKAKLALLTLASSISRRLAGNAARSTALIDEAAAAPLDAAKVRLLIEAGKEVLSAAFNVLPRFSYNNKPDIQSSYADRDQLLSYATDTLAMKYPVEEWLQSVSHVRPRTARWDAILTFSECFTGERLELTPLQLPFRSKDSWLAVQFPKEDPSDPSRPFNIEHDTLAMTIHGATAFADGSSRSGLLIDDWTETVPTSSEITGIAFNFDQPNTAPPQALLLAVAPRQKGAWTWLELVGVVNDTLLRSKLRAVEPRLLDEVDKPEVSVLLPAILADFAQSDINVALDFRTVIDQVAMTAPIHNMMVAANQ